ncbi:MAG: DNA primase [Candidatus Berkelbacteria bacterium Licking1014_96]|uniref:DNA primase n=1 Tax=Candidatus Berkelbacteria bacterium Licking1014_96 TaxID=2017149 RepID=A0A554LCH8_9BACT|nr:MAG: DNA primase [Candidatus Berkelbacteria bacterium Licking1014_96]
MDQVEEIKSRIDIVDLVSSYLELKKAGVNWKALCPFHNEKTPSFMVNSDRGSFHCFGCSEHGDIFTFVEKMEGVDFPEALKILAERAGVRLEKIEKKFYDQKRNLYEINNLAAKVYHHLLIKDKAGSEALKYLQNRGLTDKTIAEFCLGYAPQNFEFISNFLLKKDFKQGDIVVSGLSVLRDNQRANSLPIFDRFRGRVMFPLYNPAGNVIAFSGRLLKEQENVGKYINSPETPVFSKSKTIFGLDKAKAEIRKGGAVILVEGQMDVIMSHQAGFENTVASSGTAITLEQIKILRRLSSRFLFAFDADSAGIEATKKAVAMVLNQGGDVLVIDTPAGFKDSAEVISQDPSLWRKAIEKAVPYLDYLEEKVFLKFKEPFSPQDKRDIALEILPEIAKISDPIVAGDYIARLADRLKTQGKYLYEAMERVEAKSEIRNPKSETNSKSQIQNSKPQNYSAESHLLGLLLVFPEYYDSVKNLLNESDFNLPKSASIYKKLKKEYSLKRKFALKKFIGSLSSDEQDFVNLIVLDVENEYVKEDKEVAGEEILSLVERIKKGKKEELSKNFEGQIKEAEKSGNKEKIKKLIREFQDLIIQGKK